MSDEEDYFKMIGVNPVKSWTTNHTTPVGAGDWNTFVVDTAYLEARIRNLEAQLKAKDDAAWNAAIEAAANAYKQGSFVNADDGWDYFKSASDAISQLKRAQP